MSAPFETTAWVMKALNDAKAAGMHMGLRIDHAVRVLIEKRPELSEAQARTLVMEIQRRHSEDAA